MYRFTTAPFGFGDTSWPDGRFSRLFLPVRKFFSVSHSFLSKAGALPCPPYPRPKTFSGQAGAGRIDLIAPYRVHKLEIKNVNQPINYHVTSALS